MDLVLHQLGGLFLGSVPTMLLFLVLVAFYRTLVYRPLTKTLDARRALTEGAIEAAAASVAAADARAQEYEARLRAVRADIFGARRLRIEQWNRERESTLAEVRERAKRKVSEAQATLDQEVASGRRVVESSAEELAEEVLRAILPPELAVSGSSR
jgi:F-type H+-transporting ATPase subunit b